MSRKSKGDNSEVLGKIAKDVMDRNKLVFDRLAEI